jgi:DNA-binding transcriptional MerR regulator
MGKSPDAFRTISEVAAQLDTPAHVLRFWESKFPQVKPVKRAGGRRYYRPDDIALLGGIKVLLHDQGMTIRGVQKLLRERGVKHVATLSALPWEGLEPAEELSEDAPEELAEVVAEPAPVVLGPWPGTVVEEVPEPAAPEEESGRGSVVEAFVAGVAARLASPREAERTRLGRLREALEAADRERLRAEAARLRPLVGRLRTLRDDTLSRAS